MIQMKIDKRGLVQLMSEPQNTSENQLQNLNDIFDIDGQTNGAKHRFHNYNSDSLDQGSSIRSRSIRNNKNIISKDKNKIDKPK